MSIQECSSLCFLVCFHLKKHQINIFFIVFENFKLKKKYFNIFLNKKNSLEKYYLL